MCSKLLLALRAATCALAASWTLAAYSQVNVTTYHNDNARTGLNSSETTLTPANVGTGNFGLLFNLPVDGQVYAQPLYLSNLAIPGKGLHNVVFVATENDSVYAFDASNNNGSNLQPLWHVNFGTAVPAPLLYGYQGGDIYPVIGITGTPVIGTTNFTTPVLFVVAKTMIGPPSNPVIVQKLHALSCTTGAELFGGPITINAGIAGVGDGSIAGWEEFNTVIENQRPALLLIPPTISGPLDVRPESVTSTPSTDGTLYVAFASHGDNGPYHGWLLGYDPKKLLQVSTFNTTPNAVTPFPGYDPLAAGGIWMGGAGPASDGSSIYYATGNGTFDPPTGAYGDSVIRMLIRGYGVADYFAPNDQLNLDDSDGDEGSGGVLLVPPTPAGTNNKKLLVQVGKEGTVYLLDTTNMGLNGPYNNVWQQLPYAIGGLWGGLAYFNNNVYIGPAGSPLVSFTLSGGQFTTTSPADTSPTFFGYPGPTPSVSSNGNTNGIVWAIDASNGTGTPAVLHAYLATDISQELYNSTNNAVRDTPGGGIKFSTPTIANGKVYVGTANSVAVYGLGSWAATPSISPATGAYTGSVQVTITDATPGATIRYTLDGSTPTPTSPAYTGPLTITTSTTVSAKAFIGNEESSAEAQNGYTFNAVIGNGTGLFGAYFNGQEMYPTGYPTATEIDPTINFDWNGNPPITGVQGTNWAGEWFGFIEPETTGTYTFTTNSDDGVLVYINGQQVISDYSTHAPTLDTGTYTFQAGKMYTIEILYFQGGGGSLLQLSWAAPGIPQQIVPSSQLYPVPIR